MAGEGRDQTQDRTTYTPVTQVCEINETGRPSRQFIDFADGIRSILKRAVKYTENNPSPSMEERENACREPNVYATVRAAGFELAVVR